MARNFQVWFTALEASAESDKAFDVGVCLIGARQNADDTVAENLGQDVDFYRVAYDSIAQTSAFNERADVRAWFEVRGYEW